MRSEDFFGFARKQASIHEELQENLEEVERDYVNRSETAALCQVGIFERAWCHETKIWGWSGFGGLFAWRELFNSF